MKTICLLIGIALSITAVSQTDFLPSNKFVKWTGATGAYNGQGHTDFFWTQFEVDTINNDTIINNLKYTKLNYKFLSNSFNYHCGFRSDTVNQKLYLIPKDSTLEYLFFDFGVNYELGDTALIAHYTSVFQNNQENPLSIHYFKLFTIDSVHINDIYYKNYHFSYVNKTDENTTMEHSSEIISISERLISHTAFPFHGEYDYIISHHLGCYQENDTLKYDYSNNIAYGSCPLTPDNYLFSSIEEKNVLDIATIYPNPSKGEININLNENAGLKIFDLNGRIILNKNLNFGLNKLDFSGHEKGVYILEFKTENKIIHKKFIIE
jgi:hypothetical protein